MHEELRTLVGGHARAIKEEAELHRETIRRLVSGGARREDFDAEYERHAKAMRVEQNSYDKAKEDIRRSYES